jgi:hypothetical protein
MNCIKINCVLLEICRENSNSSDRVRFTSSVFHFILREDNKEAGRLLAQQEPVPFRTQVALRKEEKWRQAGDGVPIF